MGLKSIISKMKPNIMRVLRIMALASTYLCVFMAGFFYAHGGESKIDSIELTQQLSSEIVKMYKDSISHPFNELEENTGIEYGDICNTFKNRIEEGNIALKNGQYLKSCDIFGAFSRTHKSNTYFNFKYALSLHYADSMDTALLEYRKTLELDSIHVEARKNLALAYFTFGRRAFEQGYSDSAIDMLDSSIKYNPDDLYNRLYLAGVMCDIGRYKDAIAISEAVISQTSDNAIPYRIKAYSSLKLDKLFDAKQAYEKAIEIKPDFPEAYFELGILFLKQGDLIEAILSLGKAIELDSNYTKAYNYMAQAMIESNKLNEAIYTYWTAISKDSLNYEAYFELGLTFIKQNEPDSALIVLKKLTKLQPDRHNAHYNLGRVYVEKEAYEDALKAFCSAYQILPDDEYQRKIAETLQAMGVSEEEIKNYDYTKCEMPKPIS